MAQTLVPRLATLEDPEPVFAPPRPARRSATARQAVITMLVCLGAWALLFSPVLERTAESGPVGARRTAALTVLRPLAAFSDAISVSRASEAVMRALGRDPQMPPGGELELPDFELPPQPSLRPETFQPRRSPDALASPSSTPTPNDPPADARRSPGSGPALAPIRTPTEQNQLRVAIVGDSLSQGLGPAVAQLLDADVTRVLPLGRQSTGLARQDYFNWRTAMRKIVDEFRPDLVFVMLGSNDGQAQVSPDGDAIGVGTWEWAHSYRERAASFLQEATSSGARVVWVGIPVVAERQLWDFYRHVNEIYAETANEDPLATYVDAWRVFEGRDGGYTAYLRNERGVLEEMRAGDGIHFTPTGYGYLARVAIHAAADAFGLPQRSVTFRI